MSDNAELMKLYSKRILALAADIQFTDRLKDPDGSARKRAPLCGSTVSVDLKLSDGRIQEFGQDVKACALGQAAASVVSSNIIGRSHDDIKSARDALQKMLKEDGPVPDKPFEGLETLLPARDYKNRHASIMLSLDAIDEAFDDAKAQTKKDTA